MKPLRLQSLSAFALLLAAAGTVDATTVSLDFSAVYDSEASCKAHVPATSPPSIVTATVDSTCTALTWTETCTGSSSLYPAKSCSTADGTANGEFIKTKVAALFGTTNPYVVIENYETSFSCAIGKLTSVDVYWADGKCHKAASAGDSAYYKAMRKADTSAEVRFYKDVGCITTGDLAKIVPLGQANTCTTTTVNSVSTDAKVYGSGTTSIFMQSTKTYESLTGDCKSPNAVPYVVTATALPNPFDACTTTTTCASLTSKLCSPSATYLADMTIEFNLNPFVTVETYTGSGCASTALVSSKTYMADGNCHKTDGSGSYRAVRNADKSAKVQFYTDVACVTPGTAASDLTSITAAQDNTCVTTTKVYGYGTSPVYLLSTKTYDSSATLCKPTTEVPNLISAVKVDPLDATCKTTDTCSATETTSTLCSSSTTYLTDITPVFASKPFVTVETYTGSACAALTGIKSYWADGNCHKKDFLTSYRAARNSDNSAKVQFYSDTACLTPGTAATDLLSITTSQHDTCVGTTKVYGAGITPVFFLSTKTFDSTTGSCTTAAAPTLVSAVKVDPVAATCKTTTSCAGSAFPYTSTSCNPVDSYRSDLSVVFTSTPYVTLETYTGLNCALTALVSSKTYWADGNCHKKDATTSYKAVRNTGDTGKIQFYTDAACATAGTAGADLVALTGATAGGTCDGTTKTYGSGTTSTFYLSTKTYDSSVGACKSPTVPNVVSAAIVDPFHASCKTTAACAGSTFPATTSTLCNFVSSYRTDMATIYGSTPYVVVETYSGANVNCPAAEIETSKTFLADGVCRKWTSTTTSYRATYKADGSVSIKTYTDAICSTGEAVVKETSSLDTCSQNAKVTVFGVTPLYLTSTKIYNATTAGACKTTLLPVQVTTTTSNIDTCKPETACVISAQPYNSKVCGSVSTYKSDIATIFGANPYLVVETYTDAACTATKLSTITAYLADGICHQSGAATSYQAVRNLDGSAKIYPFGAADCTSPQSVITITADQVTDNVCSTDKTVVYGSGATRVYLKTTKTYPDATTKCMPPTVPTGVVTEVSNQFSCVPTPTTSTEVSCETGTTTSVVCGSLASYKTDMTTALSSTTPFVIVEKYSAGKQCAASELTDIATYVADGSCRAVGAKSYVATRMADGSATVITYATSGDCSSTGVVLTVTAAQSKANSCSNDVNGVLDTKVSGNGITASVFSSKLFFDSTTGGCKSPAVPTQIVTTKATSCTAASSCGSTGPPYAGGTYCSSILTYQSDVDVLFGSNPYVVVETYNEAKNCAAAELKGIVSYLADGKCHQTGVKTSYVATRAADDSATVTTYTDSASCATDTGVDVTVTASQASTCANDRVVYGDGATPLFLTSTRSYATTASSCSAPAVPIQVLTTVGKLDKCTPTSVCGGKAAPYTSKQCSTVSAYKSDLAATFGTSPYIILEAYTAGKSCDDVELTGITTYLADGVCHATDAAASYRASRSADGSLKITSYTDAVCTESTGVSQAITAKQAAGNSCATDDSGIVDTKVYGEGVTPWFLTSTKTYATNTENCQSPGVPSQVTTTVSNVDTCVKTDKCPDAAPYTSTMCSSLSTYKADMTAAFGSKPYVIVKAYTPSKNCAASALTGLTAYVADGGCQTTGATSYAATRASDGSVVLITYTDDSCKTEDKVLAATTAQVTGNSCVDDDSGILDTRIGGSGVTPSVYTSQAIYDSATGDCSPPAVPIQVLTTTGDASQCTVSNSCGGSATHLTGTSCSSTLTLNAAMTTLFASSPFVTVKKYAAEGECAASKLQNITSYLADGKCHATGDLSSYSATRKADGSATITSYVTSATCGVAPVVTEAPATEAPAGSTTAPTNAPTIAPTAGPTTPPTTAPTDAPTEAPTAEVPITITVTASQIGTCANDMVVSGGGPFALKSTVSYDTAGCKGIPTQVSTALADDTCVATATCASSAVSAVKCGSTATHAKDVAALYGTNPYIAVETYTGSQCSASALTGIRSFLADGKCHKTGSATGYQAAWKADGTAKVLTYGTIDCTDSPTTETLQTKCHGTTFVYGQGVPTLYFSSTKTYADAATTCKTTSSNVPIGVTSTVDSFGPCIDTPTTNGCIVNTKTGLVCSSNLAEYKTDIGATLGVLTPYVIVETYNAGKKCGAVELSAIATYIADGACHAAGSKSYAATRALDGSARIIPYTDGSCVTVDTGNVLAVTAAQATGNSCAADDNGILDTKVSGNGKTTSVFSSKLTYDSNTAGCKPSTVPTQIVASKTTGTCTASTACAGTGPYTGTSCNSILTYKDDIATLFGSNPYVVVETYNEGKSCAATELKSVSAYLADDICHKTSASTSYRATRQVDGYAQIKAYGNGVCDGPATTTTVTANQVTAKSCLWNTKVYGGGATPSYLKLAVNYDSNTGNCKTGVPSLVDASVAACTPTSTCTGSAAPFTGTSCSSALAYPSDIAAMFGSNPYVVMETYSGSCDPITSIKTYLADGKCHKTGKLTSYLATRQDDESAKILTYAASPRCVAPIDSTLTATAVKTPGACASNKRAYGNGVTPQYLTSTLYFDSSAAGCKSPMVPVQVSTDVVAFDACSATSSCTGQSAPYTSIRCGSTDTYTADLATIFGSSPYVAVHTYTPTKSCDATELKGIMVYLADGKCHAAATGSYSATRAADGSALVTTYSDSSACETDGVDFTVTAAQATGNSCAANANGFLDKKVFGAGATSTLWSAVSVFDAGSCASPTQTALINQYACAANDSCLNIGTRSVSYGCSSDYMAAVSTVYGTSVPYIVAEMYDESTCKTKDGIMAYAADTNCHITIDGLTSFTATLGKDGSGSIVFYEDGVCQDVAPKMIALTKTQLTSNQCVGASKFFTFNQNIDVPTDPPVTPAPSPASSTEAPSPPTTSAPTTAAPTPSTDVNTNSGKSGASSLTPPLAAGLALLGWMLSLLL